MAGDAPGRVTRILAALGEGPPTAGQRDRTDELVRIVYDELRSIARRQMSRERPGLTLQPTALVHEAYLRLVGGGGAGWEGGAHFFGAAAEAMRRILVERARRAASRRHGGGRGRVPLEVVDPADAAPPVDVLALDEALTGLEQRDERMAAVVKLRFFAGLSIEETARALDVTPRTVNRDWIAARAWLHREIHVDGGR